jgi:hypothetical protein
MSGAVSFHPLKNMQPIKINCNMVAAEDLVLKLHCPVKMQYIIMVQ